jgi:hypothetical protein
VGIDRGPSGLVEDEISRMERVDLSCLRMPQGIQGHRDCRRRRTNLGFREALAQLSQLRGAEHADLKNRRSGQQVRATRS